jgi:hypothetical protein
MDSVSTPAAPDESDNDGKITSLLRAFLYDSHSSDADRLTWPRSGRLRVLLR